jgi:cell division protein FtsQ
MSRSGTTKKNIRTRRAKNTKKARLNLVLRRFGFGFAAFIFILWIGAWIWLSGSVQRSATWAEERFFQATIDNGFAVEEILLEGRVNSDPDMLRTLINIERGDPILRFSPSRTKTLLENVRWVKEAHIERRLPDTIYIGLLERQPMALWQHNGKLHLIDEEGVVLTEHNLEAFGDLVVVVGEDAPQKVQELLTLVAVEPLLQERIEAVNHIGRRRWDLHLKNGIAVKLPEKDMGFALRRLAAAQENDKLMDKDLLVIDMRNLDRVTVRTRPGAVEEYQSGMKKKI